MGTAASATNPIDFLPNWRFQNLQFREDCVCIFFRATRVYIARNVPRRGVCPSLYRTTLRYSTLRHSKLGDSVITNTRVKQGTDIFMPYCGSNQDVCKT